MFKVGDKVKIAKDSKYYGYQGGDSKKGKVVSLDCPGWIDVEFENGTKNCYEEIDLVFDDDCLRTGDFVKVVKTEFTLDEWARIGKISVQYEFGDIGVVHLISNGIKISNGNGYYPKSMFEKFDPFDKRLILRADMTLGDKIYSSGEEFNILRMPDSYSVKLIDDFGQEVVVDSRKINWSLFRFFERSKDSEKSVVKHIQEEQQLMQLIKPKNKKIKLSIN